MRGGLRAILAALALGLAIGGGAGACDSSDATSPPENPERDGGDGGDATAADAGSAPFSEAEMRAASIAYNTKFCNAAQECDPFVFANAYGTLGTCIGGDLPLADLLVWYPYGSALTPAALTACAERLDLSTCVKYFTYALEGVVPEACRSVNYGTLPAGAACSGSTQATVPLANQCASGTCLSFVTPTDPCGMCLDRVPLGEHCLLDFQCVAPAACEGATADLKTCVRYRELGESCDANQRCHAYHLCSRGICVAPPAGGACDPAVGCALPSGRFCNPASTPTPKCESLLTDAGAPCGVLTDGGPFTFCEYGYACKRVGDTADPDGGTQPEQFTCQPTIADGHACNPSAYASPGAGCRRGVLTRSFCNDGICAPRGAAECTPPAELP